MAKKTYVIQGQGKGTLTNVYPGDLIDISSTAGSAGGSTSTPLITVTKAEADSLVAAGSLIVGQKYLLTDFQTVHYIVDSEGEQYDINTGDIEPLILTAATAYQFDKEAISTVFPTDIIYFDISENNWLKDPAFSTGGRDSTIIVGFKGIIYFRHDTMFNNSMWYDFRNVKFRRWVTNITDWIADTYSTGDFVKDSSYIYFSKINSNTQALSNKNAWVVVVNLQDYTYWNMSPVNTNGIVSGVGYQDFKTFDETDSNNINNTFGAVSQSNYATILSNNVFFGTVSNCHFSTETYNNTIGDRAGNISSGQLFYYNQISSDFKDNVISNNFSENKISGAFFSNEIGAYCGQNNIEVQFYNNTIGVNFQSNSIGNNCVFNIIGNNIYQNNIADGFQSNTFGSYSHDNSIGGNVVANVIGAQFSSNIIPESCGRNEIATGIQFEDFTTSTKIISFYSCKIFKREDGLTRISYCDGSDIITIVGINV